MLSVAQITKAYVVVVVNIARLGDMVADAAMSRSCGDAPTMMNTVITTQVTSSAICIASMTKACAVIIARRLAGSSLWLLSSLYVTLAMVLSAKKANGTNVIALIVVGVGKFWVMRELAEVCKAHSVGWGVVLDQRWQKCGLETCSTHVSVVLRTVFAPSLDLASLPNERSVLVVGKQSRLFNSKSSSHLHGHRYSPSTVRWVHNALHPVRKGCATCIP